MIKYKDTNIAIVYSAKHTGTWFTIDVLASAKEAKNCLGRSGGWISQYTRGWSYESFPTKKVNYTWLEDLLKNVPNKFFKNLSQLNIQAHHLCSRASFYRALKKNKSELPIVIPIRDPLLAINTFFHREYGSKKDFVKSKLKGNMFADNVKFISDLGQIAQPNIFYFPIDKSELKSKKVRIKQCLDLVKHFGLTPTSKTTEIATSWKKSNSSQKYLNNNGRKRIQFFVDMKQYILDKNFKKVNEHYFKAIELLKRDKNLKKVYKSLGYKNLLWF